MIRALLLAALLAGPAAAQEAASGPAAPVPVENDAPETAIPVDPIPAKDDGLDFDPAPVEACHEAAGPGETAPSCIGIAAGLCMDASEGGYTTVGMAGCTARETAEWDRLLNETYGMMRSDLEAADARADPAAGPGIDRSDALRDAQRAWIAYRDADCALQYAQFQDGTMGRLIGTGCLLQETARRALALRAIAAAGNPR